MVDILEVSQKRFDIVVNISYNNINKEGFL